MGRGKFKGKPTGHRHFSTPEELRAGTSARPRTFKKEEAEVKEEEESEEEVEEEPEKRKGTQGLIEIDNPNLAKQKNLRATDVDMGRTTELSRREREEIEKQKAHERYMKLQEQGKTEQARKDLERLALIRQQRAEAAKKREEEKAALSIHVEGCWRIFIGSMLEYLSNMHVDQIGTFAISFGS
ncbi:28 kDa heat- and acid-stable phosphoprotein-like isoform X1 [Hibiscus syriacus]|uniref:28 kDa heat- and acid-stable phosphoprotein-like isoform X1 n=1 Tax=Hibiscus syriacus TaxID=106335 RepID=UPI0019250AF3|nr:28 kDa heat- and acid-stable phosphoprotein-like isoform X1 [Hibiscus syriacus]